MNFKNHLLGIHANDSKMFLLIGYLLEKNSVGNAIDQIHSNPALVPLFFEQVTILEFDTQDKGRQPIATQAHHTISEPFDFTLDGIAWLTNHSKSGNQTTVIRLLETRELNDYVRKDVQLRALLPDPTWTLHKLVKFNGHFAPLVLCIVDRWQSMQSQALTFDRTRLTMEDGGRCILTLVPTQDLALFATHHDKSASERKRAFADQIARNALTNVELIDMLQKYVPREIFERDYPHWSVEDFYPEIDQVSSKYPQLKQDFLDLLSKFESFASSMLDVSRVAVTPRAQTILKVAQPNTLPPSHNAWAELFSKAGIDNQVALDWFVQQKGYEPANFRKAYARSKVGGAQFEQIIEKSGLNLGEQAAIESIFDLEET